MLGCTIVIILRGFIEMGGVTNIIKTTYEHGRLNFFNFNLDPTIRVATTSAILGQLFMSLSIFGCQQNFVQRYCSMKSQKKVIRTLLGNIPVMTILFSANWVLGMVIFASYNDCDPKKLGYISDMDEILPFHIQDKFHFLPGFTGLVMASLFNGSLSFLVSNLNSVATVFWEDFLSQLPIMKGLKESVQVKLIKLMVILCGLATIGVAFIVALMNGVIEASMLMTSATSGPLLGVFLLAMFLPSANWKGAASGMILSHFIVIWITLSSLMMPNKPNDSTILPTEITGCTNYTFSTGIGPLPQHWNVTVHENTTHPNTILDKHVLDCPIYMYCITYMYYALMGTLITVIVGVVISYLTASQSDQFDKKLIHPLARKIHSWLPCQKNYYSVNTINTIYNSNMSTINLHQI